MPSALYSHCRTRLFALSGIFFCVLFTLTSAVHAELPADAPILISESDSTRAYVVVPTKRGLIDSVKVFPPNERSRITFFVTNMDGLLAGEGANALRADAQDVSRRRYALEIESFERAAGHEGVYALTVRLNPEIGDVGDVLVRMTWRGMSSNRVRLAVGHEGSKLPDDADAVPTPMPDKSGGGTNDFAYNSQGDLSRFINQATFGRTPALDLRLRQTGVQRWLNEQMQQKYQPDGVTPRYSAFPYPNLLLMPDDIMIGCPGATTRTACTRDNYTMYPVQNWFFREALYGEDQQLRRRVSWALHQIWVVSGRETVQPSRMLPYIQVLDKHAFGNYRDLMVDMTLNPAMGNYLDMARSTAQNPNENYAREILQLFSIGLDMLNQDGTPMLDGQGNRIPTYDQAIVNGFTKVFTGWTFCNSGCPNSQTGGIVNYRDPLVVVFPQQHDTTQKQVLNYPGANPIIPAGQTPNQDFNQAIDNIFYHPNVAPFIGKLLIQQLVTSNPTPAYVGRVAAVFNDNGAGTRGDMQAVIRAILLDPEARGSIKTDPDYGHLREPVLYATSFLRPFNPVSQATAPTTCNGLSDGIINPATIPLDQDVFNPPTVFNYYQFDYVLPNTNLSAPEFGIFSTGTALKRPNFINQMSPPGNTLDGGITIQGNINLANYVPCGTRISFPDLQALAQSDPTGVQLVNAVNDRMLNGSMSPQMRSDILTAVQAVSQIDARKRARTAVYLVATSSQYQVQR